MGREFTYEEALETFPVVRELTRRAVAQIEALMNAVQSQEEAENRRAELDGAVREIVGEWSEQVTALGCEVKGLWLVDWDCGDGYYCWRWPEETIAHFHGKDEGFAGRVKIN